MVFFAPLFFQCFTMKYLLVSLLLGFSSLAFSQASLNRPNIPGELMIDIGLNYLDDEPLTIDQSGWPSKSAGLYYTRRILLNDKFTFNYGLGMGFEKIDLGDSTTLISQFYNEDTDAFEPVSIQPLINRTDPTSDPFYAYTKNRLAIAYIEAPVEFRYYPLRTEAGEGLFVGAGAMIGVRFHSKMKLKYDYEGESIISKTTGTYNLNSFRYGVQFRFGFRGVHLFYKQYLSNLFKDELGSADPRMSTIGINVSGF